MTHRQIVDHGHTILRCYCTGSIDSPGFRFIIPCMEMARGFDASLAAIVEYAGAIVVEVDEIAHLDGLERHALGEDAGNCANIQ